MGKQFTRITALGFTFAASAALALPGVASADTSPTLGGDCSATLQNGQARDAKTGLVLDAGAPLNAPDRLTVGLDSTSRNTNGSAPLLTLPVGDTVRALGIGDVPVVGDVAAAALGAYIVWEARNLGMSRWQMARMLGNVGIDFLLGAIPWIGVIPDFFFRSNSRNLRIIRSHLDKHHPGTVTLER